jgi:hypothetical protein
MSAGMLPAGYKGLVVCDTRRAREWRDGLRRRGFDVVLAETPATSDKGSWEVGVAAADATAARAFVHDVTQGRVSLTLPWYRSPPGLAMLAIIVVAVAAAIARAC